MNTMKQPLTLNPPKLRGALAGIKYPALAEIKYDGEFNFLYYHERGHTDPTHTINKNGNCRYDFPAVNKITDMLEDQGHFNGIFLCEVYWDKGKNGQLYDLLSHKQDDDVKICIFDIYSLDDTLIKDTDLNTRKEVLFELFGKEFQPEFDIVEEENEVNNYFHNACNDDWEGVVVKSLDNPLILGPCEWVKVKYKDRSDYEVSLVDTTKERIEILAPHPTSFSNSGGATGIHPMNVTVGVKCCNKYKKHIKVGDMVEIEHLGVLPSGSLRNPNIIPKKEWK